MMMEVLHRLCDWEFGNVDATTWIFEFPSLFDVEGFIRAPGPSARVKRYLVSMKWIHGIQQQEFVCILGDFPFINVMELWDKLEEQARLVGTFF